MRTKSLLFIIVSLLIFSGCVTPKATSNIKEGSNLNAYNRVYIAPLQYNNSVNDRYGVRADVEQKFINLGFTSISEYELKQQGSDQAARTLLCSIQHNHTPDGMGGSYANVRIEMYDVTRQLIYSGSGRYQGMSIAGDLSGATNQALKGFLNSYSGFDPSLKPYAVASIEARAKEFEDWETINKSEEELKEYLDKNIEKLETIEGIWTTDGNNYQLGIFREQQNSDRDFVAYILRTDHPLWSVGQVKIELDGTAYSNIYNASYYMGDHSKQGTTAIIDENGLLDIEVKQPDGSPLEMTFIKNYPSNLADSETGSPKSKNDPSKSSGSGFILSKTGLVVTNYHVVENSDNITITLPEHSKIFSASIAIKDENNDLALLRIDDFSYSSYFDQEIPFSIDTENNVKVGQEVFTIGYPLGTVLGKSAKISDGIINSLFGINDDPRLYQVSTPIQPGNSGGPLFDRSGQIVGIVVATLNSKYFYENADIIPQNVNFAVKSNYLGNIVSMLPESEEIMSRNNTIKVTNLEDQVEALTPFVVTVKSN